MWRSVLWVVTLLLTFGVGYVALDAAQRVTTFSMFTEGYGVPTKSPPQAFRAAQWNISYMLGLVVGVGTGVAMSVAAALWWRLARSRRSDKSTPNEELQQTASS